MCESLVMREPLVAARNRRPLFMLCLTAALWAGGGCRSGAPATAPVSAAPDAASIPIDPRTPATDSRVINAATVALRQARHMPGWTGPAIPQSCWPAELVQAGPLRVEAHNGNVRVVTAGNDAHGESGFIVMPPESSSFPQSSDYEVVERVATGESGASYAFRPKPAAKTK